MVTFSETDLKTLLHLRWSSLQPCNGKVYNRWTIILACCYSNLTIFTCKMKIRWKWPWLESSIIYDFLFCRLVFTFFGKCQFLFHCFTNISFRKLITKIKKGITVHFIFGGFINRSNCQYMFWKMLLIKCKKNSCEGVLF